MKKQFRQEYMTTVSGSPEWWTIGLDINDGNARPFVSLGGIADQDAPLIVILMASIKWAEWLNSLAKPALPTTPNPPPETTIWPDDHAQASS